LLDYSVLQVNLSHGSRQRTVFLSEQKKVILQYFAVNLSKLVVWVRFV
jgi:hypothetical protein